MIASTLLLSVNKFMPNFNFTLGNNLNINAIIKYQLFIGTEIRRQVGDKSKFGSRIKPDTYWASENRHVIKPEILVRKTLVILFEL